MSRILLTPAAREAALRIRSALGSHLPKELEMLIEQGDILADPNHYQGMLAATFREQWMKQRIALLEGCEALRTLEWFIVVFCEEQDYSTRLP